MATGTALVAVFALPFGAADATDVQVGAIGFVAPKYEGSDQYRVLGAPFAYPIFSNAATVSPDCRNRVLNRIAASGD